jgi:hypothetical protein
MVSRASAAETLALAREAIKQNAEKVDAESDIRSSIGAVGEGRHEPGFH